MGGEGKEVTLPFFLQRELPRHLRGDGAVKNPGGLLLPGLPPDFRLLQKLWGAPTLPVKVGGGHLPKITQKIAAR